MCVTAPANPFAMYCFASSVVAMFMMVFLARFSASISARVSCLVFPGPGFSQMVSKYSRAISAAFLAVSGFWASMSTVHSVLYSWQSFAYFCRRCLRVCSLKFPVSSRFGSRGWSIVATMSVMGCFN